MTFEEQLDLYIFGAVYDVVPQHHFPDAPKSIDGNFFHRGSSFEILDILAKASLKMDNFPLFDNVYLFMQSVDEMFFENELLLLFTMH